MDRFHAIAAFAAIADKNGFAAGARHLGISPPAATRLVGALEARLGVRLFYRTTRAVSLTDEGRRFLERARRILADLQEAETLAQDERGEPAGRLTVTAPLVFGRLHAGPLLCEFMNAWPKVQVELLLGDRIVNLVEDGVDLAIRIGPLADSSDIARQTGTTRRVLVASPGYLAARGTPASLDDLPAHRLISFTGVAAPRTWRFVQAGQTREIAIEPAYTTNSADAAIWHACRDGGITLALAYQVIELVRGGSLKVLLADFEPPPLPIQFVYPGSRLLTVKVRKLIDHALATRDWRFSAL